MTSILFLLPTGDRSRLHRIRGEELWLHQRGDDVCLEISETDDGGSIREVILGSGSNGAFQAVVPPRLWQTARAMPGACGYALLGCVVAPGFDFADFELAAR